MLGISASKWARKTTTPSGPSCPCDIESVESPQPHPSDATATTASHYSQTLLVPQSNPHPFASVILSAPIQSPIPTQQPLLFHQQSYKPLFILPKKTIVRISAPLSVTPVATSGFSSIASTPALSSAVTSNLPLFIQSKLPEVSTLTDSLVNAPAFSSKEWTTVIEDRNSSAEAFFGEEPIANSVEPVETLDALVEGIAKEGPYQLSGPRQSAESLVELNYPSSDGTELSEMANIYSGSRDQRSSTKSNYVAGGSAPFVNPYVAYVAEIDPDGTMDDGRAYVGGARHYVDKPATPKDNPSSYNTIKPAISNGSIAHSNTKPNSSTTQAQPSFKQQPEQSTRSPSRQRFSRSDRDRGMAENRWSGRALATADMLPEDFFGTAKAVSTSSATSTQKTPARHEESFTANWTSSRQSPKNVATRMLPNSPTTTQAEQRPTTESYEYKPTISRTQIEPAGPIRQEERSANLHGAQQAFSNISLNTAGYEKDYTRTQIPESRAHLQDPGSRSIRPTGQNMEWVPVRNNRGELAYDSDDDSRDSRSQLTSLSRDTSYKATLSGRYEQPPLNTQSPGNPLFLQYPIGDGCHVVVAMYVEKDAQTALKRFPFIERTRQESSRRDKTLDEMAVIFREALEDEKKNMTG
ncbi:hypothetical protein BGX27_010994 [Mortierella sp. AM989]|nr:hypothetical protein BGX27_010994 [Mortierella sp. AM989]